MVTRSFEKPCGKRIDVNDAPGIDEIAKQEGWQEVGASSEAPADVPSNDGVNANAHAAKLAREQGVDLSEVEGSGPDGQIVKGDVQKFIEARDSE